MGISVEHGGGDDPKRSGVRRSDDPHANLFDADGLPGVFLLSSRFQLELARGERTLLPYTRPADPL